MQWHEEKRLNISEYSTFYSIRRNIYARVNGEKGIENSAVSLHRNCYFSCERNPPEMLAPSRLHLNLLVFRAQLKGEIITINEKRREFTRCEPELN